MSTASTIDKAAEVLNDPDKKKSWVSGALNLAFHTAVGVGAGVVAGAVLGVPPVGAALLTAFGAAASARGLDRFNPGSKVLETAGNIWKNLTKSPS